MAHRPVRTRRARLLAEYVLLFVVLPVGYAVDGIPGALPVIPLLWLVSSACLLALLRSREFERSRLWGLSQIRRHVVPVGLPFLLAAPPLLVATVLLAPDRLFGFVRQRPLLWALVMVLYPLLSVYPQGIIYRSFIFHRYRELFPAPVARIVASAIAFALVHVVFLNWVAPTLALGGGLLFAWTYARTRSAVAASLQHALFGCFLFTIGLGWYFYYGAVGAGG